MEEKYIDAHRLVQSDILHNQTRLVNELISGAYISYRDMDECERVFNGGFFEWWLVSPALADSLLEEDELVLSHLNNNWWGRTGMGVIYRDEVIVEIAKDWFAESGDDSTRDDA